MVDEDPELVFVTAVGLTLVSRSRLHQELSVSLRLPSCEVVVGHLQEDGKIDISILDRQVSSALFGGKHAAAVKAFQAALRAQQTRDGESRPVTAHAEACEPAPCDLTESLNTLRNLLADPDSSVQQAGCRMSSPGGLLRRCMPARAARGDTCSARTGRELGVSDVWDLEEHVLVADLASGREDSADRLIVSEVECQRGCGRVFPRHDGTLEKHEALLCPMRMIPCSSCQARCTVADLINQVCNSCAQAGA